MKFIIDVHLFFFFFFGDHPRQENEDKPKNIIQIYIRVYWDALLFSQ